MDLMTIRASALADLFDCQARFYWRNIVGLRMPSSGAAHLGTALHRSTAVFDQGPGAAAIMGVTRTPKRGIGAVMSFLSFESSFPSDRRGIEKMS